jgi:hypothetical protein
MSFRRDLARRSPKEWLVRFGLVAVAVFVGIYGVTFSIAQVVVKRDPALAYRLAAYDGWIAAAYATSLAGPDATAMDRLRADAMANRALQQEPTAVAAAATLGINADGRGDKVAARRYFTYAQKLSRRDLRTQLFMIEDAVERNDIPGAVQQYDIALRVKPSLGEMLYPVLASASEDPVIRREMVKTLSGKPLWGESFIYFVANYGKNPEAAAALFLDLRHAGVAIPGGAQSDVIDTLMARGQTNEAWSYYTAIRPGADRRRSRDSRFAATLEAPSQLDWTPVNDGLGLTTSIQGGMFEFAAPASVGGPMLQQLQLLPPGIYRLRGHSIGIDQAVGSLPYWTLRCQNGRDLGQVEVPNSRVANGNFIGTFRVPADCPIQTLVLIARASDAVSGLSGQFDRVELVWVR